MNVLVAVGVFYAGIICGAFVTCVFSCLVAAGRADDDMERYAASQSEV